MRNAFQRTAELRCRRQPSVPEWLKSGNTLVGFSENGNHPSHLELRPLPDSLATGSEYPVIVRPAPLRLWIAGLALAAVVLVPYLGSRLLADNTPPPLRVKVVRGMQPTYSIQAGIDGDVFPAVANYESMLRSDDRDFGIFTLTISNPSESALNAHVAVQVPGWSDVELQNVTVGSGEVRKLLFAPVFLPRLYENHEIAAATGVVKVTDSMNRPLHSETVPVRLRSVDDMNWGANFGYAPFIASWVTPHDPRVEAILTRAKELMPGRRLPGYEDWKPADEQRVTTRLEARAIYRAVQETGVSYVKSSVTFGHNTDISERVRMPGESLRERSANCIDGVVLYASLFENLGMDPVILLVPGHAFIGVRDAEDSNSFLYIESAITGRASFETAVKAATKGIARVPDKSIIRILVSDARTAGIYPMPLRDRNPRQFPVNDFSAEAPAAGR
jgi:hypothetical protein